MSIDLATVDELSRKLDNVDYLADQGLATALLVARRAAGDIAARDIAAGDLSPVLVGARWPVA